MYDQATKSLDVKPSIDLFASRLNYKWWPYLTNMLINCLLMLPSTQTTLMLPPQPQKIHPLQKTLLLLMCHLSGDCSKVKEFQKKLPQSSYKHGDRGQKWERHCCKRSINPISPNVGTQSIFYMNFTGKDYPIVH